MLPKFPKFKKLDLSDRSVIESFSQNFPSYSEYSFSCMFMWDVSDPVYYSILNDNLVIKFTDFRAKSYYYSLIGQNKIDETIEALIEHAKAEGVRASLHNVPGIVVKNIKDRSKFEIEEDRDNHDYLLSVTDLVQFKSKKYHAKKNLLNRFEKNYGHRLEYKPLDLTDFGTQLAIRRVLENWESHVAKDSVDIIVEFAAIEKSLKFSKELGIKAYGSFIDGQLEAFTIYEKVDSKTVLIHFDKANKEYIGIFEHLKHNLAKHLADKHGVEVINFSQDLGLPGLREAKLSYRPIGYLKKYIISRKAKVKSDRRPRLHKSTARV